MSFFQHWAQGLHMHRYSLNEGTIQSSMAFLALGWIRGSWNLRHSLRTDRSIQPDCGVCAKRMQHCYVWFYKGAQLKGKWELLSSPHSSAKPWTCWQKSTFFFAGLNLPEGDICFLFSAEKWAFATPAGVLFLWFKQTASLSVLSFPRLWEGRKFGYLRPNSPLLLSSWDA